ncbi:hypothetical protein PIB30_082780, partial [Stylosanthes scabra]|nr:hypothetical protein [Stylosanthes scabra]
MTQGYVWSKLETWPKRDSLRAPHKVTFESRFGLAKTWPKSEARQAHKLSKQGHVWTKFQTWPKRGSPNPSPRLAEFQRSVN